MSSNERSNERPNPNRVWMIVVPLLLLALGGLGYVGLKSLRQEPETRIPERVVPLVRTETVRLEDRTLTVRSQGTVVPRTSTELTAEVSGRVVEVAPELASGIFFDRGDLLVRIDPLDYRERVTQARAQVAQAELQLERERAEAELAREEWAELGDGGDPPPLTARRPQIAQAEAALASARAAVERAERDLERTALRAPYDCVVREKWVDVGQYVGPGARLVSIFAVDYAEVRLPLPDDQLAYLDLPLGRIEGSNARGPRVELTADFAGSRHTWTGRIVRTEAEIDASTRMVHAIARVDDPYGRGDRPERPPLSAGLFVQATIEGRRVENVAVVPRAALREGDRVLVVDDEDRLRFRDVEVLRALEDRLVVRDGLEDGERVCLSPIAAVTDGMQVRVESDARARTGTPSGAAP